jgi:hypothetical protein
VSAQAVLKRLREQRVATDHEQSYRTGTDLWLLVTPSRGHDATTNAPRPPQINA